MNNPFRLKFVSRLKGNPSDIGRRIKLSHCAIGADPYPPKPNGDGDLRRLILRL